MQANNHMLSFLGVFFLVFFLSSTFLYLIDFVPEPREENQNTAELAQAVISQNAEVPTRIRIPEIGVDTPVNNPQSSNIQVLDDALLSGAVRYPGSALLGQDGTVFIFGHQSNLPVVRNEAFRAFNRLQELESGDVISVYSDRNEYQYRVTSVTKVRAEEALIPLTAGEGRLVLSTCNSFGDPGERYVVEAEIINNHTI